MERLSIKTRTNWQDQVESVGLTHHTLHNGKICWNESNCYRFNAREINELETATNKDLKPCV